MVNKDTGYNIILFLLWPLFSLYTAFRNPQRNSSYNIIWLYAGFIGLTFTIYGPDATNDLTRYLEEYNTWMLTSRDYYYLKSNIYVEGGYQDMFFPVISFLAAKIGLSEMYFLGLIGLVFGFFYSRVYKSLMLVTRSKKDFFLITLLAAFLLVNPIWRGINGIRFSLSAIIYVYIILNHFNRGFNLKTTLLVLSLILIHFSMALPIFIYLSFLLLEKILNARLLFVFFVLSFFFTSVNLDIINEFLKGYVPVFLYQKVDAYARESVFDELAEQTVNTNWYALFFLKALFYACSIMLTYIYFRFKDLTKNNARLASLIKFTLFYSAIANLVNFIPSLGRMALISNMLVIYIFILLLSNLKITPVQLFRLKVMLIPLLLIYIVVQLRIGFDFISIESIIGNPILATFNIEKVPLIDLIK